MTPMPREHYRDTHILVVEKPFGLPSQPTRKGERNLYDLLVKQETYVGLHHRLDTPASGLLVVALDRSINARLAADFKAHRIERRYQMVVIGCPPESGTWEQNLDGKSAITHFRRLATRDSLSLLEARLETGRTHQIRRHASSAGFPIVGDRRYGGGAARLWDRLALHAHRLCMTHPVTEEACEWTCPPPENLKALFEPLLEAQ